MKHAIQWLTSLAVTAALTTAALAVPHDGWTADFEQALVQAKKENKAVLVEFTGSDWCPPCIMMRKKVFSKAEFVEQASKNFILVELDFPRKNNKELAEKNKPYAIKYGIKAFPTIILMDSDGKPFNQFSAGQFPEVDAFIAHIEAQIERRELD